MTEAARAIRVSTLLGPAGSVVLELTAADGSRIAGTLDGEKQLKLIADLAWLVVVRTGDGAIMDAVGQIVGLGRRSIDPPPGVAA